MRVGKSEKEQPQMCYMNWRFFRQEQSHI